MDAGGSRAAAARKPDARAKTVASVKSYNSPVKPLPAAAVKALVRTEDDWNEF